MLGPGVLGGVGVVQGPNLGYCSKEGLAAGVRSTEQDGVAQAAEVLYDVLIPNDPGFLHQS